MQHSRHCFYNIQNLREQQLAEWLINDSHFSQISVINFMENMKNNDQANSLNCLAIIIMRKMGVSLIIG